MWGLDIYWENNYSIAVYDIEKISDAKEIYDKKFNSICEIYIEVVESSKSMEESVEVYISRAEEQYKEFKIPLKSIERYLKKYKEKYPEEFI